MPVFMKLHTHAHTHTHTHTHAHMHAPTQPLSHKEIKKKKNLAKKLSFFQIFCAIFHQNTENKDIKCAL